MKIAVINYSGNPQKGRGYNLATEKMRVLFARQGHEIAYSTRADMWTWKCQKAYCSALFTYDLPAFFEDIPLMLEHGLEIEAGGPAITAVMTSLRSEMKTLTQWLQRQGIKLCSGLDERFEHVPGEFEAIFTSRGCPRACEFCLVSKLEGRIMLEYDDFNIPVGENPMVCDNNILATSWRHQELVVERLKQVRNLDFNSGFDDRIFIKNPERYWRLYSQLKLECWRFAYDLEEQREVIKACADFLHGKGVSYRSIIVFCLVGWPGTTFEYAREKLQYLIDIGTSPYPMRYRPLDSLAMNTVPPGWNEGDLDKLFQYYGVPWIWRSDTWENFRYLDLATRKRLEEAKLERWEGEPDGQANTGTD